MAMQVTSLLRTKVQMDQILRPHGASALAEARPPNLAGCTIVCQPPISFPTSRLTISARQLPSTPENNGPESRARTTFTPIDRESSCLPTVRR